MDRALPFPGWTLPGVFTLGGAQIALKSQGVSIGRRVAFVGAGPLLPLVAHQYVEAGAQVVAVLDVTPFAREAAATPGARGRTRDARQGALVHGAQPAAGARRVRYGVRAIRAEGKRQVEALVYKDATGAEHRIACDAVGASFGLRSETQLADLAGCAFVFDTVGRQWVPQRSRKGRSSVPAVYLAGDGAAHRRRRRRGAAGPAHGARGPRGSRPAGRPRARPRGSIARLRGRRASARRSRTPIPFRTISSTRSADEEIVCRCEGITAGALREAARDKDAAEINRLKAFTRIGMGRCQGRVCGHAAAELLARA